MKSSKRLQIILQALWDVCLQICIVQHHSGLWDSGAHIWIVAVSKHFKYRVQFTSRGEFFLLFDNGSLRRVLIILPNSILYSIMDVNLRGCITSREVPHFNICLIVKVDVRTHQFDKRYEFNVSIPQLSILFQFNEVEERTMQELLDNTNLGEGELKKNLKPFLDLELLNCSSKQIDLGSKVVLNRGFNK